MYLARSWRSKSESSLMAALPSAFLFPTGLSFPPEIAGDSHKRAQQRIAESVKKSAARLFAAVIHTFGGTGKSSIE